MSPNDLPPLGRTLLKREIPRGWRQMPYPGGFTYDVPMGMHIVESAAPHSGGEWYHVSLSYRDHLPSWEDLGMVKRILLGLDRDAIMVLPRQKRYVNIHKYCLHLWHRLDGESAPDFAMVMPDGTRSI